MTQRIHDRLNDGLDNEILVRAIRTGKFVDQFTADCATPEEVRATLSRLPMACKKQSKNGKINAKEA